MNDFIARFFGTRRDSEANIMVGEQTQDILVATCALLLEMANIDGEFSEPERLSILSILKDEYHLTENDAMQIADISQRQLDGSLDLWKFTNLINQNYSEEEKIRVIELIWKVVYIDDKLDKHEDYLIHKLAHLLNLSPRELIDAKVKVLHDRDSR